MVLRIDRHDRPSTQEEADILIAQHAISLSLLCKFVRIICDDAYVFVLPVVHYYSSRSKGINSASMIMSSPVMERAVIDICATVEGKRDLTDYLPIHGLPGADAVASFHGIGKATVVNVAKNSMTECRVKMCRSKTG